MVTQRLYSGNVNEVGHLDWASGVGHPELVTFMHSLRRRVIDRNFDHSLNLLRFSFNDAFKSGRLLLKKTSYKQGISSPPPWTQVPSILEHSWIVQ